MLPVITAVAGERISTTAHINTQILIIHTLAQRGKRAHNHTHSKQNGKLLIFSIVAVFIPTNILLTYDLYTLQIASILWTISPTCNIPMPLISLFIQDLMVLGGFGSTAGRIISENC